jgi:hypothetical protein
MHKGIISAVIRILFISANMYTKGCLYDIVLNLHSPRIKMITQSFYDEKLQCIQSTP